MLTVQVHVAGSRHVHVVIDIANWRLERQVEMRGPKRTVRYIDWRCQFNRICRLNLDARKHEVVSNALRIEIRRRRGPVIYGDIRSRIRR